MIYRYKGISKDGKKVSQKVEATSLKEAKSKIKAKGIIYQSIKEDSASIFANFNLSMKYKISPKELSELSRELAMYIKSGITIVQALKISKLRYESKAKMSLFLSSLSISLDEGKSLYQALDIQSVVILPEFYKHSVKVSESSGILDEVLLELSRFLKEQDKINKEIKGAFAYPSFMIVVSLLMISFMLAFVVPQITGIFVSMNQELPMPTQVVVAMGDFFNDNFTTLLVGIFTSVAIFIFFMKKSYNFRYFVHKIILKTPLIGTVVLKSELARFSYIASLLTRSGVVFVETINLSSNTLNNLVLKELFKSASKRVVEGELLSLALNESHIKIDKTFIHSIALGEETSQIEAVLTNISELYFEENRDKITLLLTMLEPALMLFVGGSIGMIVAAMLLPIFSMSIS